MEHSKKIGFFYLNFYFLLLGKHAILHVTTSDDVSGVFTTDVLLEGKFLDLSCKTKILCWDPGIGLGYVFLLSTIYQRVQHFPPFSLHAGLN